MLDGVGEQVRDAERGGVPAGVRGRGRGRRLQGWDSMLL